MIPACIFKSLNATGSHVEDGGRYRDCYRHVLAELAQKSGCAPLANKPDVSLPSSFAKYMLQPIPVIVDAMWESLSDTLLATRDERNCGFLTEHALEADEPVTIRRKSRL